jgi:hypothetical protein
MPVVRNCHDSCAGRPGFLVISDDEASLFTISWIIVSIRVIDPSTCGSSCAPAVYHFPSGGLPFLFGLLF